MALGSFPRITQETGAQPELLEPSVPADPNLPALWGSANLRGTAELKVLPKRHPFLLSHQLHPPTYLFSSPSAQGPLEGASNGTPQNPGRKEGNSEGAQISKEQSKAQGGKQRGSAGRGRHIRPVNVHRSLECGVRNVMRGTRQGGHAPAVPVVANQVCRGTGLGFSSMKILIPYPLSMG